MDLRGCHVRMPSLDTIKFNGVDYEVKRKLIPCLYVQSEDYNLLVNLNDGKLIKNLETCEGKDIIKKIDNSH